MAVRNNYSEIQRSGKRREGISANRGCGGLNRAGIGAGLGNPDNGGGGISANRGIGGLNRSGFGTGIGNPHLHSPIVIFWYFDVGLISERKGVLKGYVFILRGAA